MKKIMSRRSAIKATAATITTGAAVITLDQLCKASKVMGISSIDLSGPTEWPSMQQYGLTSGMANGAGLGIENGWNRRERLFVLFLLFVVVFLFCVFAGF